MKSKEKLIVALRDSSLSLALFKKDKPLRFEKIFLRETPEETLKSRVASFSQGKRPATLLLLPRSEVIAKELILSGVQKESLESKLEELFPYPPKEMAYGFSQGLLLAVPEKRLRELLAFLERLGIVPDEIVTEDQPLLWLLLQKKEMGPLLLLDESEERTLSLFLKEGKLSFSRVFPKKTGEENSFFPDLLGELSLALLEAGEKPEKVLFSGNFSDDAKALLLKHFSSPVERFGIEGNGIPLPAPLYGAPFLGRYPTASLLPGEQKIKRRFAERKRLIRECLGSFLLFLGVLTLSFLIRLQFLEGADKKLAHELASLVPQVKEARGIESSLEQLRESHASKEKLLGLLKEMGTRIPSSIRLREFRIEGNEFFFKGESPSHAFLAETVEALEGMELLQGAKLEHTRLRKKLNQDFFEFEVTAKCLL